MSRLSEILLGNNSNKEMILPNPVDRTADTNWWGKVAADAIATGAGQSLQTAMHGLQDLNGDPMYGKELENWGAELANEHQQFYEPGSARYYANAGLQSLPEMGADLGISLAAAAIGSPVAGAAKTLASGYKWLNRIGDVYKGARELSGIKGGLARMILPSSPQSAIGAMTSTGLEAAMEGQRAMDDYIEEAKRNGTYVHGVTEDEGRNLRSRVFRDNAALLGLTNAAEFNAIFKNSKGIMGGLGRLGTHMASEGLEEAAQQIIPKAEQGKDWSFTDPDVIEAGLIGAGMGGVMHGAGRAAKAAMPSWFDPDYNPMSDEAQAAKEAKLNSDVPLPGNIDYTEADPGDIINDWLNKQAEFNVDMDTDVDVPQAQQGSSLPSGNEASGGNSIDGFDSRYMQKYESKPGATDLAGVQPKVKSAFNGLAAEYGGGLIVTGGAEKGYHAGGENGHEGGWKLDIDKASVKDPQKFLALCKKYGFAVGDEGDHYDLSAHSKGGVGGTQVVTPDAFISDESTVSTPNSTADMSRFNSKQQEAWHEAQWVQQQTGIPAEYVYRQWAHESGNFTSRLARENNNFGGLTQSTPNGEENKQPDGGNYYRMYNNMHEYAESYVKDFINRYDGKENVKTMEDFVNFLHSNGYFTADPRDYLASMQGVEAPTSRDTISTQDFGKLLGKSMIDFAGSEDDNIMNSYQRIMDNMDNGAKSVLTNKFANMFNQDGSFNNTAENRQALAQDNDSAELIMAAAGQYAPQLMAPLVNQQGRISKQAVKEYFTPHIAGVNMHFLKDAIKKDKLTDTEKAAVLQEAVNQLNVPRPRLGDNGQAKFVNDLQKAIDTRDFGKIYSIIPQETAKAIAKVRPAEAQPAMPIVTQEQLGERLNGIQGLTNALNAVAAQKWDAGEQQARDAAMGLHEPVKAPTRQMATPEEQARLDALTGQPNAGGIILPNQQGTKETEANLNALRQSAGVVDNQPEASQVPGVLQSAEDKVAANAAKAKQWQAQNALRNGDYDLASRLMREDGRNVGADILDSVPHRPYTRQEFDSRLAELQRMPLRQLEQVGQQTLDNMQSAGVPVSEGLAKDLTAGKEKAIAHAESKMSEAGVTPTISDKEKVAPQELSKPVVKETKVIAQFREKATDVVEQYRDGNLTYEDAFSKLNDMYIKADKAAKTKAEHDAAAQTFLGAGENLERIRQEKESQPQKTDYSNMSLDELKAERQRLIDDEVERMNRNPGGKGTNSGYTYNERGEITGRYGESLNPQWYQDAYADLGHAPRKKEYPDIALKNLQKHQEFAELEDAIATQEKQSVKNESSTKTETTENTTSNEEAAPETENPFGDLDETFADLAKQAGITPIEQEKAEPEAKSTTKEKPKKKKRNMGLSDTSKEREEELKKQLSEALKKSRNRLNSTPVIFDPDVIVPAFNLGRLYVQRGAENFAEYARDMIDAVGDSVRGWLRPVWEMIENYPES